MVASTGHGIHKIFNSETIPMSARCQYSIHAHDVRRPDQNRRWSRELGSRLLQKSGGKRPANRTTTAKVASENIHLGRCWCKFPCRWDTSECNVILVSTARRGHKANKSTPCNGSKSGRISQDTYCLHGNGSHRCHSDRYGSLPGMQHTLGLQAESAMLTTDWLAKEAVASEAWSKLIKQPMASQPSSALPTM